MTSEDAVSEFRKKVARLTGQGWKLYGKTLYWDNAITQTMIMDPIDMELSRPEIEKAQLLGRPEPCELNYRMGGRGHMGEKHWYD